MVLAMAMVAMAKITGLLSAAALPECNLTIPGDACYTREHGGLIVWPAVCPGVPRDAAAALMPSRVLRDTPAGRFGYDFANGCTPDMAARNMSWLLPSSSGGGPAPPRQPAEPEVYLSLIHI